MSNDDDFDEFFDKVGTSKEAQARANPAIQKLDRLIKKAQAEGRYADAIKLANKKHKLLKELDLLPDPPKTDVLGEDAPF